MDRQERLHALDAVRAFALLLGVLLHACMSFVLPLPAQDSSQSSFLAAVFFVIHIFRMSVFYLIAGFFARMLFQRRGLRGFVRDRSKRILIPLILGWIALGPLTIAIVIWGLSRTFGDEIPAEFTEDQSFPLLHFWFLYYLALFYVLACLLRQLFEQLIDRSGNLALRIDGLLKTLLHSPIAALILASPICALLYYSESWPLWAGIPTPDQGFTPQLPAMLSFGMAFGLGWLVHRQIQILTLWQQSWSRNLVLAIVFTLAALTMIGPRPDLYNMTHIDGPTWMRFAYALCYTLAIWYWCFALIGVAMRFFSTISTQRRYVADASYWIYLAHLPLIFFLQVLLMDLNWHWSLKLSLILSLTMTILFASYHYYLRFSWMGDVLNGKRATRTRDKHPSSSPHE